MRTWNRRAQHSKAHRRAVYGQGMSNDTKPANNRLPTLNLARLERMAITQAMARHGGGVSAASISLGISRQKLSRRLERLFWRITSPSSDERRDHSIRKCARSKCTRLRTAYAREHWRCFCGYTEVPELKPSLGEAPPPLLRYGA